MFREEFSVVSFFVVLEPCNCDRTSLRSKRFQSRYCAKVKAGAEKKVEGGGGGEKMKRLPGKAHDSGKRPLIFHGSVHL